eukprot:812533_1
MFECTVECESASIPLSRNVLEFMQSFLKTHSIYVAQSLKDAVSADSSYKEALLHVILPIPQIQFEMTVFWALFKNYCYLSDAKYSLFASVLAKTNGQFGTNKRTRLNVMPPFSAVNALFDAYTSDVGVEHDRWTDTKFGLRRSPLDIILKILCNDQYREYIQFLFDGTNWVIVLGNHLAYDKGDK